MGLVRGAFRASRSVGRTTYRAGRSVAKGRVPSMGVSVRLPGGLGVRAGTRGVSLRTPIGRQSIGASGFRTTVGVPGLASVTINPVRPSATIGVGPGRVALARNPGISLAAKCVAVGVTSRPLLWARVGPVQVKVPGRLPGRSQRPWHEEVDEQWRSAGYRRRPPGVSTQLHHIIRDIERSAVNEAERQWAMPEPAPLPRPVLSSSAISQHRLDARRAARRETSIFARRARRAALEAAEKSHLRWVEVCRAKLDSEYRRLAGLRATAVADLRRGDPVVSFIVANAMINACGANAILYSIDDQVGHLLVLAPSISDVHPSGPSMTPAGARTIRKRTKHERQVVHDELVAAAAVHAINAVRTSLVGVSKLEILIVYLDPSARDLRQLQLEARLMLKLTELPRSVAEMETLIRESVVPDRARLERVASEVFRGDDRALAVAVVADDFDGLREPGFWTEVAVAAAEIRTLDPLPEASDVGPRDVAAGAGAGVGSSRARATRASSGARPNRRNSASSAKRLPEVGGDEDTPGSSTATRENWWRFARDIDAASEAADIHELRRVVDRAIAALPALSEQDAYLVPLVFGRFGSAAAALEWDDVLAEMRAIEAVCSLAVGTKVAECSSDLGTRLDIVRKIMAHLRDNSGSLQSGLGRELGVDQDLVRWMVWNLDHFGRVTRVKKGRSYCLWLVG